VALLAYAPVLLALRLARPEWLLLGLVGAVCIVNPLWPVSRLTSLNVSFSLSMLPDLDMKLPGVKHRGITHTVWFAVVAGLACGLVGLALAPVLAPLLVPGAGPTGRLVVAGFLAYVGVHSVLTHLLADVLTPMGIEPFAPLDGRNYSLDLWKASNPAANYGLLAVGALADAGALLVG
jgi:inner membrane protein